MNDKTLTNSMSKEEKRELARQIKADLCLVGITQKQISAALGISPICVNDVIFGRRDTLRTREAIAKATGKYVIDYWPEPSNKKPGLISGAFNSGLKLLKDLAFPFSGSAK